MSNFSLLDTLNGSRWDTSANNINTVGYVSCNGGTDTGTYYSNYGSAFRVPNGTTSARPSPGLTGYLRFNTDQSYNCLEYYDPLSALWTPIYPIPTITSVNPNYVTDASGAAGYYNTNPLVISGYGYVPGCTVSYRGTDSSVYAAPVTTYVSNIQLTATVPASVYNGYNQDPFTIIVTNPSGVSGFLLNALDVDPSASWVTPAGAITNSLGGTTVDSSFVLTTSSSPYFRVQAIDLEGATITYNSPDISNNSATSNCAITTLAGYAYITGTPYSLASATVSFTVNAIDGTQIVPRNFSITVNASLRTANVSSAFAYQITYTNSAGASPTSSGPYPGGYTVYTFNPNATTTALVPTSPQTAGTYQTAAATYTFTPNFTSSTYSVLVVGGGGAGAGDGGATPPAGNGGGGGGGVLYNNNTLTMTNGVTYTITVGAGGGIGSSPTQSQKLGGANSSISGSGFTTLTANGGGGGGFHSNNTGQPGGSGGGASGNNGTGGSTTQTSIGSATGAGNAGSGGTGDTGGGGGGAGAAATNQNGGAGISNSITGTAISYGGGGGGAGTSNGSGGAGGGTAGATNPTQGANGLGGGSGGQISGGNTARGGSGVVIIRFLSYSG